MEEKGLPGHYGNMTKNVNMTDMATGQTYKYECNICQVLLCISQSRMQISQCAIASSLTI